EDIDSNTIATIGGGAKINQTTTSTSASVDVSALNNLSITTFAGGLGVGGVGIGASVGIRILHNDTTAIIGNGALVTAQSVDVNALSLWTVNSNAISFGAGIGGIGGGIVIYTMGGDFSDNYQVNGQNAGALSSSNGSVLSFMDSAVGALTSNLQQKDPGIPP